MIMGYDLPLLGRDTRLTLWQVKVRALLAQTVSEDILVSFQFKVEFWDYSLLEDILLQLYDEHSYQKMKKKIWRR